MVLANVKNTGCYLPITEHVSDRLWEIFRITPQIWFAYREGFPLVSLESASKLEDEQKLFEVDYEARSVLNIDEVPSGMKQNGRLVCTPENIAMLLKDSTKTFVISLYDLERKIVGKQVTFFVWGEGKAIVFAKYTSEKNSEDSQYKKTPLLTDILISIVPGYTLPSDLFSDYTASTLALAKLSQQELCKGAPNKAAIDEIVEKLIPAAVKNFNQK